MMYAAPNVECSIYSTCKRISQKLLRNVSQFLDMVYQTLGVPKYKVLRANMEELVVQGPEGPQDRRIVNSYPSKVGDIKDCIYHDMTSSLQIGSFAERLNESSNVYMVLKVISDLETYYKNGRENTLQSKCLMLKQLVENTLDEGVDFKDSYIHDKYDVFLEALQVDRQQMDKLIFTDLYDLYLHAAGRVLEYRKLLDVMASTFGTIYNRPRFFSYFINTFLTNLYEYKRITSDPEQITSDPANIDHFLIFVCDLAWWIVSHPTAAQRNQQSMLVWPTLSRLSDIVDCVVENHRLTRH